MCGRIFGVPSVAFNALWLRNYLDFACYSSFQEREEKNRAEVVSTHCVLVPSNFAQCSRDTSPTFSMDDFEGDILFIIKCWLK